MISDNPDLKKIFPEPPMASLRQGPNLRRKLCKATLPKLSRNPTRATHRNTAGWKRCSTTTGRQCPVCPLTPTSATSITSHLTNYTHTLTHSMNCKTENVIYLWKCTKCGHNFDTNRSTNTHNVTNHEGTLYCGMWLQEWLNTEIMPNSTRQKSQVDNTFITWSFISSLTRSCH